MKQKYRLGFSAVRGLLWLIVGLLPGNPLTAQTLTLLGQVNAPGTFKTDVWGYVDPTNGKEYAIMGDHSGTGSVSIIDVSIPDNPVVVFTEATVPGFDVKVWQHYIYSVNGGGTGLGGIMDISNPTQPTVVGHFPNSHNIFISENGFLFAEFPGLKIYDLNPNPLSPQLIWSDGVNGGGHDASVIGNRLYDFHGTPGTFIYDISTINTPVLLGAIQDPNISYHHSGWVTEDQQFLFICDELANDPQPDITAWDISDPGNPVRVGEYGDPNATVHNLYVIGNFAYVSYYTAGLRIFDVSTPANITLAAEFDTTPVSGETFRGAFGVYPFSPNGLILVSDWDNGLFVFSFSELTGINAPISDGNVPEAFHLWQNFPNPFNPETTIRYQLPQQAAVTLRIFNGLGQVVRTLIKGVEGSGIHEVTWDGRDDNGRFVGSGIYFYQLTAPRIRKTRKMVLLE